MNFWVYVTTVPLTLLTIAGLVLAQGSRPALRRWWLTAGLISLVDRLFTFDYFIPTMITLMAVDALPRPRPYRWRCSGRGATSRGTSCRCWRSWRR